MNREISRNFKSDETHMRLQQELSELEIALPKSEHLVNYESEEDRPPYLSLNRLGQIREMLKIYRQ